MFSVPKASEARGTTGAASVAALCVLSMCAGGAYAVDAARHSTSGPHHIVPVPRIREKPNTRTDLRWALFTYTDREPKVTFRCSLDGSKYVACSSRTLYGLVETKVKTKVHAGHAKRSRRAASRSRSHSVLKGPGRLLSLGTHTFRVKAHSRTGRESREATYTWTIMTKAQLEAAERAQSAGGGTVSGQGTSGGSGAGAGGGSGSGGGGGGTIGGGGGGVPPVARTKSFIISGEPEGALSPGGGALLIPLTLFNPNPVPISVTSLTVSVAGSPEGCAAEENLRLTQSDVSAEKPVVVPAETAVTLPAQGVSAPTIEMLNLPVNQNACQNGTFPLTYIGSAHS
jgi:uncharacterized membrane protein YgcG